MKIKTIDNENVGASNCDHMIADEDQVVLASWAIQP